MKVIYPESYDEMSVFSMLTIGFFDGVHAGHRYLIAQLHEEAAKRGLKPMVVTFRQHPRKVLHPEIKMPLLTTLSERLQLLEYAGVERVALLDFTPQMAQMSARKFMQSVLKEQLNGKALLIGYDHHFGRKSPDGFEEYCNYGAEIGVEVIQARELPSSVSADHASSTVVRCALAAGDIELAHRLMGHAYTLGGIVTHGQEIGRTIGFPTANIAVDCPDKIVPANGVYAVRATVDGRRFGGMLYIGNRPTVEGIDELRIEVNLLDFTGDIYGKELRVDFLGRIRGESRFESLDRLKAQLVEDKEKVVELLGSEI